VEIIKEITEKLMEKLQDIVNQKLQDALKKFQNIKKKNLRRHGNNWMNSERTSTNIKVKQRRR
jgi:hypothetical protein